MSDADAPYPDPPHQGEIPAVSPQLLESLVCPATGGRLTWDPERRELISKSANLAYPVRQGIPIMLIDEARTYED